jgi:phosphomannomutase
MTKSFIFDVDGTLTPSRSNINEDFRLWFCDFAEREKVYLVTGSDKPKTVEQVGEYLYNKCRAVYQCAGNDLWVENKNIHKTQVNWDAHTIGFFSNELANSKYPVRTGIHSELRPGLINFSIVGRLANAEQRADYVKYDKEVQERIAIVRRFNLQFPQYQASVAGEIGIDIVVKGCNKSQILKDFDLEDIIFFGDKCDAGGNDYEIAEAVAFGGGRVYNVKDWKDTWVKLKGLDR